MTPISVLTPRRARYMLLGAAVLSASTSVPPTSATSTHFGTLPPGSSLPSDSQCATRVCLSAWEPRPDNDTANHTVPTSAQLSQIQGASWTSLGYGSQADTFLHRVTGNYTGTTDEIIQWAACKWGIDEDLIRAEATNESWWHQHNQGDYTTSSALCPPGTWNGSSCYQSYGLLQIKYYWQPFTWPMSRDDSAFNVDYAYAMIRACYEGWATKLGNHPGDIWGCVGAHYSGAWYDSGAQTYIGQVQNYDNTKPWLQPGF